MSKYENFPLSQAWGNSISSNATCSSNSQVQFTFLAPKTLLFLYLIPSEVQLWSLMIHYHFVLLKLFLLFQNVTAWKWRKQAELQNLKFILSTGKENQLIACDWSTPLLGKAFLTRWHTSDVVANYSLIMKCLLLIRYLCRKFYIFNLLAKCKS
jgi:hypothetical protein